MARAYRYPDAGDATTAYLIAGNQAGPDGWVRCEDLVLAISVGQVAERFGGLARCLDAGAGAGRLTRRFGAVAASVVAQELDSSRLDYPKMKRDATEGGYELSLRIGDAAGMAQLPETPFDVVVLSHVIQHTPRSSAEAILKAAAMALHADGFLYLSLPISGHNADEYVLAHVAEGQFREDPLGPDEFDYLCSESGEGRLPTRKFGLPGLLKALGGVGFRIDDVLGYHFKPTDARWPVVPCVVDLSASDSAGVIDVAVLATRS